MKAAKRLAAVAMAALLTGCGGSGGGSGDGGHGEGESFAGIWKGEISIVRNNCNLAADDTIQTTLTVNQADSEVVVDIPSGDTFTGTATDTRLNASKVEAIECPGGTLSQQIEFGRDAGSDDALVTIQFTTRCGAFQCDLNYLGSLKRTVG
ncbi:hypothetical protein EP7_004340 [Isosphaeraceae bacterium EP7]